MLLDQAGICASSGSACTTGSLDPSHVLTAMGCSAARARSSIRFSLGIYNTEAEVDYVLKHLPGIIAKLRASAPVGRTGRVWGMGEGMEKSEVRNPKSERNPKAESRSACFRSVAGARRRSTRQVSRNGYPGGYEFDYQ